MRTVVLGGTRFIGRAVVDELLSSGHEPLVVHRGEHEPGGLPDVPHLHVHRRQLASRSSELSAFAPDGLIDLSAMTGRDAATALDAVPDGVRKVVASSIDVYRAFSSLWEGTVTDTLPLTEDSPLRSGPPPDRAYVMEGYDYEPAEYEKLDVEAAYLARGGVVCRLPMVYGPTTSSVGRTSCSAASAPADARSQPEPAAFFGRAGTPRTWRAACAWRSSIPTLAARCSTSANRSVRQCGYGWSGSSMRPVRQQSSSGFRTSCFRRISRSPATSPSTG